MYSKKITPTELKKLISSLKQKEIDTQRLNVFRISQNILMHPEQKTLAYNLQQSLKKLNTLLSA